MSRRRPEVWGGLEGTINRVGERYLDQCKRNGHEWRLEDLDAFQRLGIRALRYPLLWERVAPHGLEHADWAWADARMERLRATGIRPILGLVHHGSGPRDTSLLDPGFPQKLARYARAVAERYPWVDAYTPVNEPLTTARFSALYGHWYPHHESVPSMVRALLNQCRAVVLAMREIRAVNPRAELIQTDDMGHTYATPRLAALAEHENHRRWLGFDLLCGKVGPEHALWGYLLEAGASEEELGFFRDAACSPDVVGLNYYITSDRLLDERMERYPAWAHNEQLHYADVHSILGWPGGVSGHRFILEQAWKRYGLPVAFTEVHLGATREEQLRWLHEAWTAACELSDEGVDVRAITVWSLLGAFDWNTLVTAERGFYEPGAFDVRGAQPRPTAIATMTRELARHGSFSHPVLATPGWWRRRDRVPHLDPDQDDRGQRQGPSRPMVITGAKGTLAQAFARIARERGLDVAVLPRDELEISSRASVAQVLAALDPWAVINAAGYVRVDEAEVDPDRCFRDNAVGPATLAAACEARGVKLLTFSSDLVFDGRTERAYREDDEVGPLNIYGFSKAIAERAVLDLAPGALVVRTSAFFGPWDRYNFVTLALQALRAGEKFRAAEDVVVSPTYVPDLVNTCLDLLLDDARGIWHLANAGHLSWAELARRVAGLARLDPALVVGVGSTSMPWVAQRPMFTALTSQFGAQLPALDDALARYLCDCEPEDREPVEGGGRDPEPLEA